MRKKSNKQIIKKLLLDNGQISNYYLIDNRITTRASEYIRQLREEGLDIETEMNGKECIYKLKTMPKKQVIEIVEVDGVRKAVYKMV